MTADSNFLADSAELTGTIRVGTFVGRQREMGLLFEALEDALSGQGRLVMLVGEPGIGKTRTAWELASLAEREGAQVLWGWCYEKAGAPPFWPWVQLLRSYIQKRCLDRLRQQIGPGAADIAEIIPEVREKLSGLEPPPALEPEQARFRLFASIATFLKNAAQTQALMLVLDDLHWADQASLLLLEFLAREMQSSFILVVGIYRDVEVSRQHPLSDTLAQLAREPVLQRVLLRGLSQEDTESFIKMMAGLRPPQRLAEAIYTRTEGNPFFMTEVIRSLREQGELVPDVMDESQGIRIPEGVREVLWRRLNRLSEQCNQVLTTASVIGRQFDFKLLGALNPDMSEDQLLRMIDEALSAHLVEEFPGLAEGYQFSHSLVQETLASELSAARRVRLHARIGEALEKLYGAAAEAHVAELAYHFAEASPVTGPERVVRYSLLAGERALAAYAWEDALAHFQRALAAKEGRQPMDAETAALLFGLGRSQLATLGWDQLQEAVDNLERAFDYYAQIGDVAGAVAIAQYPVPALPAGRTGVAGFIARALKLVPPDSLVAGQLLCSYGLELGRVDEDYENAQAAFARALVIAQREGALALEVRTLAAAANVAFSHDFSHDRFQEGLEKARRAIELADRLGDPQAAWSAHRDAARMLTYTGEAEAARQHATAALELAERLRGRYQLSLSFRAYGRLLILQGDWQNARSLIDRGLAIDPQETLLLGDRLVLEYQVGDFGQGAAYLERFLATLPPTAARPGTRYSTASRIIPWISRITGVSDRLDIAAKAAQTVVSSPFANPRFAMGARAGLGLLAVLENDAAGAAEEYKALQSGRGMMGLTNSSDRLLGLLAQTQGNLDKATEHFEHALAFSRHAGYQPELAWTCHDYAEALLLLNNPGDHEIAMSLLDEALTISQHLGMRPLMERVIALQGQALSQPSKSPVYPDGLTQREVEVLRLIALGWSDRDIAEELVLSTRTVNAHVRSILNKTAVANRTEAATFAARHGLT